MSENGKRRRSTWKREGEKVPRWNCMKSKETEFGIGTVIQCRSLVPFG